MHTRCGWHAFTPSACPLAYTHLSSYQPSCSKGRKGDDEACTLQNVSSGFGGHNPRAAPEFVTCVLALVFEIARRQQPEGACSSRCIERRQLDVCSRPRRPRARSAPRRPRR